MRISCVMLSIAFICCLAGCGPMIAPMPARLDVDLQKQIDAEWEKSLTPIDKHDHQMWLDVFVGTGVYQHGVDKLYFRSEKSYSGGLVVMEVHFDRALPNDDRFEVKVIDPNGKILRAERYGREAVEKTYRELFTGLSQDPANPNPPDFAEKQAARLAKIYELFPKPVEKAK